jgi:hypothetical protein
MYKYTSELRADELGKIEIAMYKYTSELRADELDISLSMYLAAST